MSNNVSFNKTTLSTRSVVNDDHPEIYFDPDFLLLDLERIRIFISVLEEYEEACEREENYPEAAITRDKIKLLRDVEEIKILSDLNKLQEDQVIIFYYF